MAQETNRPEETKDAPRAAELSVPATQSSQSLPDYLREYARQKPDMAALWCLGIGFVLGWKLKPW